MPAALAEDAMFAIAESKIIPFDFDFTQSWNVELASVAAWLTSAGFENDNIPSATVDELDAEFFICSAMFESRVGFVKSW